MKNEVQDGIICEGEEEEIGDCGDGGCGGGGDEEVEW